MMWLELRELWFGDAHGWPRLISNSWMYFLVDSQCLNLTKSLFLINVPACYFFWVPFESGNETTLLKYIDNCHWEERSQPVFLLLTFSKWLKYRRRKKAVIFKCHMHIGIENILLSICRLKRSLRRLSFYVFFFNLITVNLSTSHSSDKRQSTFPSSLEKNEMLWKYS